MSLQTRMLVLFDVILRVPPLFVIDELLRTKLGLAEVEATSSVTDNSTISETFLDDNIIQNDAEFYTLLTIKLLRFFLSCLGCMSAICMFLLSLKHLFTVYVYLMSAGIVILSYWANLYTMTIATEQSGTFSSLLEDILSLNIFGILNKSSVEYIVGVNCIFQFFLSYLFVFTYSYVGPMYPALNEALRLSFIGPNILVFAPLSKTVVLHAPVFATLLPIAVLVFVLWYGPVTVVQTIYHRYQHYRNVVNNFGLTTLVETEWFRLKIPCILRTFWLLRVAEHAATLMMKGDYPAEEGKEAANSHFLAASALLSLCKSLLTTGCETVTALLGMTSIVSYICHYIGCFFQWILLTEDEEDKSIGIISAILFYILALQTGLTSLDPEKRFIRLFRNLCLLCTAVLHFIHNIVSPLLLSLSASNSPSFHRHIRALAVCGFLIVFPISLLYYLWLDHMVSTWLLAVSVFSIEVIVKVLVSLSLYVLFLVDAQRASFWEGLDDYVYYIRAFGNTVEFFFGVFLFLNGAWILIYESGGAIRAIMMCIHGYFNIWCEAGAGWSSFMKRRTAVTKINSLPEASDEQLNNLDDLCAICFQEMETAKITRCKHFFHGVCLRKWLYVQDRCPLCQDILYQE